MRLSRDIETELYDALTDAGYSASAHSVPQSLGDNLPHVHITRTGGYERDFVIEVNQIDFDIYAEDPADALICASQLCGVVRDLAGDIYYTSEITTLPYSNTDPRHPSIARATFKAQILTRTV